MEPVTSIRPVCEAGVQLTDVVMNKDGGVGYLQRPMRLSQPLFIEV